MIVFKTISDRVGDVFVQARVESLRFFKRFSQHFVGAQRSQLCVSVVGCIVASPYSERHAGMEQRLLQEN